MVSGNDILEHTENCDDCIKLENRKNVNIKKIIKILEEEMNKLQEECFNNYGRD